MKTLSLLSIVMATNYMIKHLLFSLTKSFTKMKLKALETSMTFIEQDAKDFTEKKEQLLEKQTIPLQRSQVFFLYVDLF